MLRLIHGTFCPPARLAILLTAFLLVMLTGNQPILGQENHDPPSVSESSDPEIGSNEDLINATKSLDNTLRQQYPDADSVRDTRDRIVAVGLVGGTVLSLLSVLFAYLKLDHATRGFRRGRLQLLALLGAAVVIGTSYFLWMHVLFK